MTKIKSWPKWLKVFGIISLAITAIDFVILLFVWIPCFTKGCDGLGEGLITAIILLPILAIIAGCWVIGFLAHRWGKWFSAVLISGAVISGIIVVFTIAEYFGIEGFDFRGWFPLPFSLIIFLFFIIATSINLRKSHTSSQLIR